MHSFIRMRRSYLSLSCIRPIFPTLIKVAFARFCSFDLVSQPLYFLFMMINECRNSVELHAAFAFCVASASDELASDDSEKENISNLSSILWKLKLMTALKFMRLCEVYLQTFTIIFQ